MTTILTHMNPHNPLRPASRASAQSGSGNDTNIITIQGLGMTHRDLTLDAADGDVGCCKRKGQKAAERYIYCSFFTGCGKEKPQSSYDEAKWRERSRRKLLCENCLG